MNLLLKKKKEIRFKMLSILVIALLLAQMTPLQAFALPDGEFAGGNGEESTPYQITDWEQLNNVRNYLGAGNVEKHFVLMNDLDSGTAGYAEYAGPAANGGKGWIPIGTGGVGGVATHFTGSFDGNGKIIKDLFINDPGMRYAGLFGTVNWDAGIKGVRLEDVDITGDFYVGGLAGYNWGSITGSSAVGTVSGVGSVGGLAGHCEFGSLVNSYAICTVTGSSGATGGLTGYLAANSVIENSFALGSVTTPGYAGGLAGLSSGVITDSYAACRVTGDNDATVGGLVGEYSGNISGSYYDSQISGQADTGKGIPKTTAEMKDGNTFDEDWDFADTWTIVETAEKVSYPYLQWMEEMEGWDETQAPGYARQVPAVLPTNGSFTDTDDDTEEIGGTVSWTAADPTTGITGYKIYWGSDTDTKLAGHDSAAYTVNGAAATFYSVAADTALPEGATHFLIHSYNAGGDSENCLAVIINDAAAPAAGDSSALDSIDEGTFLDGGGVNGINRDPEHLAWNPQIAELNDELYVTWSEGNMSGPGSVDQIRVAKYNGTEWDYLDGDDTSGLNYVNTSQARDPDIAVYDDNIFVIWDERAPGGFNQVKIKKYDGTDWEGFPDDDANGDSFNYDTSKSASNPSLLVHDGKLYAAWTELNSIYESQIRVKTYDGDSWTSVDGGGADGLNYRADRSAQNPQLASDGSDLYATWTEYDQTYKAQIRVKKYDGAAWTFVDGNGDAGINIIPAGAYEKPSIVFFDSDIHVAWIEYNTESFQYYIRVKKFDGMNWTAVGDDDATLNYNASSIVISGISLAVREYKLYAFWSEAVDFDFMYSQIRAKKYDGTNWQLVDTADATGLNKDPNQSALAPKAITINDSLYLVWHEDNNGNNNYQIRVKKHKDLTGPETTPDDAVIDSGDGRRPPAPVKNTPITIDGQTLQQGATVSTQLLNGRTTTTVTLDTQRMTEIINSGQTGSVVEIPITGETDTAVGTLDGQLVKAMENRQAVLEIRTDTATYTLPAQQINIDAISAELGQNIELSDIKISIRITNPPEETVEVIEDQVSEGGYSIVVPPIEFSITATYGNQSVEINRFNAYVDRTVAIPDGVDPEKITTAVVADPDGTVRHVPTQIVVIDGKYYAKISSLTNSVYSVIWNPVEFTDAAKHWAKDEINDMGSRMVVSGDGNGNYAPDRDITRAEFAAIVVKALGLQPGGKENNPFGDVKGTDWFAESVSAAYEYGIVAGDDNNLFRPQNKITREQAMTMAGRAMDVTGLKTEEEIASVDAEKVLAAYIDAGQVSNYAKSGAAACIDSGIINGKGTNRIAPKENITRAEVAVIIKRLLEKSGLI